MHRVHELRTTAAEAISDLWKDAGLSDIEVTDLTMECLFSSFDELWQRYLTGEGPPAYMAGLSADRRDAVKERCGRMSWTMAPTGHFRSRPKRGG